MVWFSLAAITWAEGNQYFICCYETTKCFGVIAFMKWWQRRGRVGELVTLRKYIWKLYQLSKRFVYYWYLVPQSQVTSEFSWDRDIYVEPWCFLCCKPERDVERTVVWSMKWDPFTSSWYTVIISESIDQCNGMIPNRTKAMATQFTDAYLSLDSDKWNDKERWLLLCITHEYGMAWKRFLHYFDLHLNKRLNKSPPCRLLNALRRRQVTVMASRITG